MKKAISFLKETEVGIIVPIQIKEILGDDYDVCLLNHDSWEDLIDYCNLFEYRNFIFISNGNRVVEIAKCLNSICETERFSVYSEEMEHRFGHHLDLSDLSYTLGEVPSYNEEEILNQGSYACITGIYPPGKNTLKHIFLEKESLKDKLSLDLFLKSDINAAVILPSIIMLEYPFIVVAKDNYIQLEKYETFELEKLKENIIGFEKSGNVQSYSTPGVIDFGIIIGDKVIRRIVVSDDGVYSDILMKNKIIEIEDTIDINILKNEKSLLNEFTDSKINHIYNLLATLGFYLKLNNFYTVTPFNKGFLPPTNNDRNTILGILSEEFGCVYNVNSKKLFRVDKEALILLEFYIKNQMDHPDLSKLISNKLVIDKFLKSIANIV
jgi:hypothetical protein